MYIKRTSQTHRLCTTKITISIIDEYHGHVFWVNKRTFHRNISFECLKHNFTIEGKQPKPRFGCLNETVLLNTQIVCSHGNKEKFAPQKADKVGPPTACQRYAISMAYRWWAVDGPTLCASWDGDLMTLR